MELPIVSPRDGMTLDGMPLTGEQYRLYFHDPSGRNTIDVVLTRKQAKAVCEMTVGVIAPPYTTPSITRQVSDFHKVTEAVETVLTGVAPVWEDVTNPLLSQQKNCFPNHFFV